MAADPALVHEAFALSGEKHFRIARRLYPLVFGRRWGETILAFAYLKCLDDLVDEDADAGRALATIARQRALIAAAYGDAAAPVASVTAERFGLPVFAADRACGGGLRGAFETILASMELDTRRRGRQLAAAALDAYVLELGGAVFTIFTALAGPGARMPPALVAAASRAYLYADALIDLRHDLVLGVINVPAEDGGLDLADGGAIDAWIAHHAPAVLAHFTEFRSRLAGVRPWTLRVFVGLYLAAKRRKLRRFLAGLSRPAPASAVRAAAPNGRRSAVRETPAPLPDAL
jgi:hypothetical protein